MKVVDYVPNRVMATKIQDGSVEIYGRITFEPLNDNKTKMTTYVEIPSMEDSMQNREFMQSRLERSGRNQRQLMESEIQSTIM